MNNFSFLLLSRYNEKCVIFLHKKKFPFFSVVVNFSHEIILSMCWKNWKWKFFQWFSNILSFYAWKLSSKLLEFLKAVKSQQPFFSFKLSF
jgi:hypothetical protein